MIVSGFDIVSTWVAHEQRLSTDQTAYIDTKAGTAILQGDSGLFTNQFTTIKEVLNHHVSGKTKVHAWIGCAEADLSTAVLSDDITGLVESAQLQSRGFVNTGGCHVIEVKTRNTAWENLHIEAGFDQVITIIQHIHLWARD